LENHLSRLRIFTEIPPAMEEILVKIMVELLGVLALATLQIKQGRLSEFVFSRRYLALISAWHREIRKEVAG
jgi:hypothetical protein